MAVKSLLLVGLVAVTIWNVTRSEALGEARNAYVRHDLTLALRYALDHLNRRPWSHDAAVLAAVCLSQLDYPDQAEPYYRLARRTGGLSLEDLHARAYGLTRSAEPPIAIAAYEEILRREPDDRIALRRLATIFYAQKLYARAEPLANRLIGLRGSAPIGYALLGTLYHENANPVPAIEAYQKVLELDPDLSTLPFPAGIFWGELTGDLVTTGRATEARQLLIEALIRRDDGELHFLRAKVEDALESTDEAEACLHRAVERDPKIVGAWLLLGRYALRKQQPQEALTYLKRAWELKPETQEAVHGLSRAYRLLGMTADAERFAKEAARLRPSGSAPRTSADTP